MSQNDPWSTFLYSYRKAEFLLASQSYRLAAVEYLNFLETTQTVAELVRVSLTSALKEWSDETEDKQDEHLLVGAYHRALQFYPHCENILNDAGSAACRYSNNCLL